MKKISIVLLVGILIFTFIGINYNISFAGEGSLSVPSSVNVGENFTVTVVIPPEAVGYNGDISVKFSDGTTETKTDAKVTGLDGDYKHPGNMSCTFSAKSEGTATITVSNLTITDSNGTKVNAQKTLSGSVSIVKKQEAPQPAAPTTPAASTTPTTPAASTSTTSAQSNEPSWTNTGDTVVATETVNVRSGWGTSFSSLGKLAKGTTVTRNAKGSNGWDKVTFKGQTGYILSKLLTTKEVEPDEEENTNVAEENTNTVDPAANLAEEEKDVYNRLVEEVGVLPTVGRNFADYVYTISVLIAIGMIGFIGLKIRDDA